MENGPLNSFNNPTLPDSGNQSNLVGNPQVMVQPVTYTNPVQTHVVEPISPGQIILQWLTYAFWGWTVLAMAILTAEILLNSITGLDTSSFTPYGIAAVLVLLPISLICDIFYTKQEPEKKVGASSVVMIIHAVIFALFGIGSAIAVVFSFISLVINNSSSVNQTTSVTLYSSLISAILYTAVFLRTIRPEKLLWINRAFMIFMSIVVVITTVLAFTGPIANAKIVRNDKLLQNNLDYVSSAINSYALNNKQLPKDLNSLGLTGDAKQLVTSNLVTYKQDKTPVNAVQIQPGYSSYYYELCVTYVKSTQTNQLYAANSYQDQDGYSSYISAYSHPAGNICYKLKTQ